MFHAQRDASKVALMALVRIDARRAACGCSTFSGARTHLASLGAIEVVARSAPVAACRGARAAGRIRVHETPSRRFLAARCDDDHRAAVGRRPPRHANVPKIRFESVPDFLKYSADMNLGEVLGVAINSKGTLAVLNHPGQRHRRTAVRQRLDADSGVRRRRQVRPRGRQRRLRPRLRPRHPLRQATTISGSSTKARTPSTKFNPAGLRRR